MSKGSGAGSFCLEGASSLEDSPGEKMILQGSLKNTQLEAKLTSAIGRSFKDPAEA